MEHIRFFLRGGKDRKYEISRWLMRSLLPKKMDFKDSEHYFIFFPPIELYHMNYIMLF